MNKHVKGFTLIELMVTLVVLAILMFLALPSYTLWIQNTQIRTAAESILSGLTLAKGEAARRNTAVELKIDAGSGWTARISSTGEVIQSRVAEEGTSTATVTVTPNGSDRVTFSGLGRLTTNDDGSVPFTEIKVDSTRVPAADSRELCVVVNSTGMVRMCDPNVTAPDTRACTPAVPAGCM